MNDEVVKIALYQHWPGQKYRKYNVSEIADGTRQVSVFPATAEGLEQAIDLAERADAILVKLSKDYFNSEDLLHAIKEKIRERKFVPVFRPINKLPGN